MLYLGFSGGLNLVHENPFEIPRAFTHDGAAVLVEDGEVIAAIEEERLNRISTPISFRSILCDFVLSAGGPAFRMWIVLLFMLQRNIATLCWPRYS
jgi:carbamoyltransferase